MKTLIVSFILALAFVLAPREDPTPTLDLEQVETTNTQAYPHTASTDRAWFVEAVQPES